jgi:hypothetical protein
MNEIPTPDTPTAVLSELLRLYDWRFVLAARENADDQDPGYTKETKRKLAQYGREKKAAWDRARKVLA